MLFWCRQLPCPWRLKGSQLTSLQASQKCIIPHYPCKVHAWNVSWKAGQIFEASNVKQSLSKAWVNISNTYNFVLPCPTWIQHYETPSVSDAVLCHTLSPSSNTWRAKGLPDSAANAPKHQVELLISRKLSHPWKFKMTQKRNFHIQKNDVTMSLGALTEILWSSSVDFLKDVCLLFSYTLAFNSLPHCFQKPA